MSIIITIKVIPSSGRLAWKLDKSGQLKCYLTEPPEKGKANRELIGYIAKTLGLPQGDVVLISGEASRTKKIKINAVYTLEQILAILGLKVEQQTTLF